MPVLSRGVVARTFGPPAAAAAACCCCCCCCLLKRVAHPWPLKGGVKPRQGKPSSVNMGPVTDVRFPDPPPPSHDIHDPPGAQSPSPAACEWDSCPATHNGCFCLLASLPCRLPHAPRTCPWSMHCPKLRPQHVVCGQTLRVNSCGPLTQRRMLGGELVGFSTMSNP